MIIETINPTETIMPYYAGSFHDPCNVRPVERYSANAYEQPVSRGFVKSYRGPRQKHVSHEFERYQYKISGMLGLWVCNMYGYSEGGRYWMLMLNNHPYLQPMLSWSYDLFKISAKDVLLRDNVVASLYEKANAARFNTAVFVAELGETIKYITDLLKAVIRITKVYSEMAKRVKDVHSTWLEYRYAIMPLILTVEDALAALQPKRPKDKVQNFSKIPNCETKQHDFTYAYGKLGFVSRREVNLRCGSALEVLFQNDVHPWGTSFYDVIMAGWERIPLSFVFDWALDVGQFLGSFRDTGLIVSDKYATLVKETKLKVWLDKSACTNPALKEYPSYDYPFVVSAHHIIRYIGDDVLPPTLPCLNAGHLSLLRKIDGLALTIGYLLGIRKRR